MLIGYSFKFVKKNMASVELLKPDRKLLDPKFNGYKLSLESLPVYRQSLQRDILQIHPSDEQYSLQHIKLFNHHNHLYLDDWNLDHLYYVTSSRIIHQIKFEIMHFSDSREVFQCPPIDEQHQNYNISLFFPSKHHAFIGNGAGCLYLLETGQRPSGENWKIIFSSSAEEFTSAFTLLHAVSHSEKEFSCLLLTINDKTSFKGYLNEPCPFVTVLHWITLKEDDCRNWTIQRTRQLIGTGTVLYASLCSESHLIYLAASSKYKFIYDSTNPVESISNEENEIKEKLPPLYVWTQSLDEIIMILKIPKEIKKTDISVTFNPKDLKIELQNLSVLLHGQLFSKVNAEASTWILENKKLQIIMPKIEEGLWQELIVGDDRGEETTDLTFLEEIYQKLAHLTGENTTFFDKKPAYNCQELEECDANPLDFSYLMCYEDSSHDLTQEINLSSNQWLFNANLSSELPLAFCIRHDVDGIVWQPTNNGQFEHKITFNALGYVQASKLERKFSMCSPNGQFAVISDARRHLYLYHQPSPITSSLRNRHTGQNVSTVAKQQLISLDSVADILGLQVTDRNVYVLTKDTLYALRVKTD